MSDIKLFQTAPPEHVLAGHQFKLLYSATREDGGDVQLELSGTTIKWILCPYGSPNAPILTLTNATSAITVSGCEFDVNVTATDTYNLEGTYIYQVEITSPLLDVYRPLEGILIIEPRNKEDLS